jgi:predicted metal-dependent HD superfamily phosphohydrolase
MSLRDRFLSFARTHGASADVADRWWRDLERRYAEPHRHYHTLAHIEHMLDVLPHASETVLGAVWFHDAIYGGSESEERSAELARQALAALQFPAEEIESVAHLILATKTHAMADLPPDGQRFLDADLSILGSERERYRKYVEDVREEYAPIPEPIFRSVRNQILRRFLERPRIYGTDEFFERFEAKARANIEWELTSASPQL